MRDISKPRPVNKSSQKTSRKKPTMLALSPPDGSSTRGPIPAVRPPSAVEEQIPWAEIIFESSPISKLAFEPVTSNTYERILPDQSPPLAIFGLAALGLAVLLYFIS